MKTDVQIIDELGGPSAVAKILGFSPKIGTQRVYNWKTRGIPAAVRLENIDIFGLPGSPVNSDSISNKEAAQCAP